MITKGLIKKTLTAGMLALMACTSMSVMAESEWVWVADVVPGGRRVDSDVKGFHAICEYGAQVFGNSTWPVTYDGSYDLTFLKDYGYIFLACFGNNTLDDRNWFSLAFDCPWNLEGTDKLGTFSLDRPDGCYEFKELNIPRNNDWCEIRDIDRDKYKGAVACDEMNYDYSNISDIAQREYYPCVWNDAVKNDTAKSIVAYCTKLHEDLHIQQARSGNYSQYGQPTCRAAGWLGFEAPDNSNERYGYHNAEHEAFALDSRCLQGSLGLCGDDQACRDEIERHINHTKTDSERHQQCAGFSSNKSQEYSDAGCNKI